MQVSSAVHSTVTTAPRLYGAPVAEVDHKKGQDKVLYAGISIGSPTGYASFDDAVKSISLLTAGDAPAAVLFQASVSSPFFAYAAEEGVFGGGLFVERKIGQRPHAVDGGTYRFQSTDHGLFSKRITALPAMRAMIDGDVVLRNPAPNAFPSPTAEV